MQWINVEEQKPVMKKAFLEQKAFLEDRPIQHTGYIVCRSDGVVQFSPAYTGFGGANIGGGREVTVTHWMPLPAPPVANHG